MIYTGLYKKMKVTIEYEDHSGKTGTAVVFEREAEVADIYMNTSTSRSLEPVYDGSPSEFGKPVDHKQVGPTNFMLMLKYGKF